MASLARPPLGESRSAYQGAPYIFGLTGYGVDTPADEAGTFLPVPPFPSDMRQRTTKILLISQDKKQKQKLAAPCTQYV
jgi:hypothetical protein